MREIIQSEVTELSDISRPSFSKAEYHRRIRLAQEQICEKSLDAVIFHNLSNICYLSGFQTLGSYGYGHYALLVPASGHPTLFASDFESFNAKVYCLLEDVVTYPVLDRNPVASLAVAVKDRGHAKSRIGYETGHYAMTIAQFAKFCDLLPGATFTPANGILDPVKIVKSDEEITMLRRSSELTTIGMNAGLAQAREGASDNDIAAAMYESTVSNGAEYFSLQPIVTVGRRSGIPHTTFRRQTLSKGDVIFTELSASFERYSAPCMRTACVGEPPADVRRAYDGCRASVESLLENMKDGASAREVAEKANKALRAIEPDMFWHGYFAYSVGCGFPPMCNDCEVKGDVVIGTDLVLQAGMIFHVNTSLRRIGEFGVAMSESALVTKTGCEPLTSVPRGLLVV